MFRIVERIFVFVLLLSSMTVVDALTRPAYASAHDPSVLSTDVPLPTVLIEAGVYVVGMLLVLCRWRQIAKAARRVWPLVALTLLAAISVAWSDAPSLTIRRTIFLLGSTLIGIYVGERFTMEQLSRWLAQVLCLLMASSIIMYFIAPSFVIDYDAYDGAWKGLTINKNAFGWYMAIAVVVLTLVRFRHFRWLRYIFLAIAAVLLLFSRSATSLAGCFLVICIVPLWPVMRAGVKMRRLAYALILLAICAGTYFIWTDQALLFRVLGRDSTFTGRTNLWALVLSAIEKHPFLGYGYGAFWSGMKNEVLNIYIASKWLPTGAHNGYLELWLGIGIPGIPILLYLLFRSLRMAKDYIRSNESWLGIWPMTYLLMFILHNFFESHLLETRSLEYLLFTAIITSLAMQPGSEVSRVAHASPYLFVSPEQPVYSPAMADTSTFGRISS